MSDSNYMNSRLIKTNVRGFAVNSWLFLSRMTMKRTEGTSKMMAIQ